MSFMNWQKNMDFVRPGVEKFAKIPRVVKMENREGDENNIFEKKGNKEMKKKEIRERIGDITHIFDDSKLSDLISSMEKIEKENKKVGYSNLEIEKDYPYISDSTVEFHLYGTREETDKEYEKRMKLNKRKRETNKQNKIKQKDKEIKRLKELMEKYPEESKIESKGFVV